MLGATLKLDSTLVAFKGLISDQELDQHLDQDFYYELDKILFVYCKQIGEDRYSQLVDKHKMGGAMENLNQSSIGLDDQSTTMLTIQPKSMPISHSTPTLEPLKIHEVQAAAPIKVEYP